MHLMPIRTKLHPRIAEMGELQLHAAGAHLLVALVVVEVEVVVEEVVVEVVEVVVVEVVVVVVGVNRCRSILKYGSEASDMKYWNQRLEKGLQLHYNILYYTILYYTILH